MKHEDGPSSQVPLRLAFIAPWNYSNGLGVGARGYLSALWHTRHQLNLHPIHRPFHVHARLPVSTDVLRFSGPADIAIVGLNPDSWTGLLTDDQKRIVRTAHARIGVFVWEMDAVPPAWGPVMDGVDAIWTPSQFCADAIAKRTTRPVHVMPHVVPVAPPPVGGTVGDWPGVDRRMVLYAFDGASYMARKRPMALVEAFAAAGLGARGWHLVLKTKNLSEAPAEGAALSAIAAVDPTLTLLTAPLREEQMAALMDAADIYASPHCSEGFGLTIAEAMARGKLVVATDYGGNRDFLDASCGFPVPGRLVRLADANGPYPKGGAWTEVDIGALADALTRAADLAERGDLSLGVKARARVAERLSAAAVAARMEASMAQVTRTLVAA